MCRRSIYSAKSRIPKIQNFRRKKNRTGTSSARASARAAKFPSRSSSTAFQSPGNDRRRRCATRRELRGSDRKEQLGHAANPCVVAHESDLRHRRWKADPPVAAQRRLVLARRRSVLVAEGQTDRARGARRRAGRVRAGAKCLPPAPRRMRRGVTTLAERRHFRLKIDRDIYATKAFRLFECVIELTPCPLPKNPQNAKSIPL